MTEQKISKLATYFTKYSWQFYGWNKGLSDQERLEQIETHKLMKKTSKEIIDVFKRWTSDNTSIKNDFIKTIMERNDFFSNYCDVMPSDYTCDEDWKTKFFWHVMKKNIPTRANGYGHYSTFFSYIDDLRFNVGNYRRKLAEPPENKSMVQGYIKKAVDVAKMYWQYQHPKVKNADITCECGVIPTVISRSKLSTYANNYIRLPLQWYSNVIQNLGSENLLEVNQRGYEFLKDLRYKGKKVFVLNAKHYPIQRLENASKPMYAYQCQVVLTSQEKIATLVDDIWIVKVKVNDKNISYACHDSLRMCEQLLERKVTSEVVNILTDI